MYLTRHLYQQVLTSPARNKPVLTGFIWLCIYPVLFPKKQCAGVH